MGTRPGRSPHALSTVLACVLTVGMVAGVAMASPDAFDRAVTEAKRAVLGGNEGGARTGGGRDPGDEGASGSTASEGCDAILDAYRRAAPPSDDVQALARAIEVVRDNCSKNPQARGLVVAFGRLIDNAEGRGGHGPSEGRGVGGEAGRGHGGEPGRPDGAPGQGGEAAGGRGNAGGHGNGS